MKIRNIEPVGKKFHADFYHFAKIKDIEPAGKKLPGVERFAGPSPGS